MFSRRGVPPRGIPCAGIGVERGCGGGASWAWIALSPEDDADPGCHHLLIRRNDRTGELSYLRCYSPHPVTLGTLVGVAGQRWRIEESFQAAKDLTGLDQHQVRRWTSWHRWTTLAMLAHAFLAVAAADERDRTPAPDGLIMLTVNEFRHLFDALLLGARRTLARLLHWSTWRRMSTPNTRRGKQHAARSTQHANATTSAANHNDHDLRLQY